MTVASKIAAANPGETLSFLEFGGKTGAVSSKRRSFSLTGPLGVAY
jgi:hypothetical protein